MINCAKNKLLAAVDIIGTKHPSERIMVFSETIESIQMLKEMLQNRICLFYYLNCLLYFVLRIVSRIGDTSFLETQHNNTPKTVYPPSSEYVETKLEACPRGDIKSAFFICKDCNNGNNFFWHKQHGDDRFRPAIS